MLGGGDLSLVPKKTPSDRPEIAVAAIAPQNLELVAMSLRLLACWLVEEETCWLKCLCRPAIEGPHAASFLA